jgi:hypothetical protein
MAVELMRLSIRGKKKSIRQLLHQYPIFGRTHLYIQILIAMIFFRAENIQAAWIVIKGIFSTAEWNQFDWIIGAKIGVLGILLGVEFLSSKKLHPFEDLEQRFKAPVRWGMYYLFIFLIIRYGGPQETFIYFQF